MDHQSPHHQFHQNTSLQYLSPSAITAVPLCHTDQLPISTTPLTYTNLPASTTVGMNNNIEYYNFQNKILHELNELRR